MLNASIWQHLSKLGKGFEWQISEAAESLWQPIPVDFSKEIRWEDPHPAMARPQILMILGPLLLVGAAIYSLVTRHNILLDGLMTMGAIIAVVATTKNHIQTPTLKTARRAVFQENGLLLRTKRDEIRLPWSDIKIADWYMDEEALYVGRSFKERVLIPYKGTKQDSSELILAIIAELRTFEPPILLPIPEALRAPQES